MIRLLLLSLSLSCLAPASLPAQETRTGCEAPEHRQFDFWIGEWSVRGPQDRVAGENAITAILNGCALREEWRGARGSDGTSLNFYDRSVGRWRQTWIDDDGQPLQLSGGLDDAGRMVLSSEEHEGRLDRITWTALPDGTVTQLWERTADRGATWEVVFHGTYHRKEGSR